MSGGGSSPLPQATAQNWVDMINEYQKGALVSRLGIPMIYGIDAVHGHNNVYNATIFPHNVGLGATRQVLLINTWLILHVSSADKLSFFFFTGILTWLRGLEQQLQSKSEPLGFHTPLLLALQ